MTAMSESFVDLSYRGLALGKRIKLTQVRPTTGYLELPTPMPVGTTIGIATDDGVLLEATVAEVREQVTGSDRVPGMIVKPRLDADAARTWWKDRVSMPDPEKQAPQAAADGKVTVVSRRMSGETAVPEVMDDGRNTAVMSVIDDGVVPESPGEPTDPSLPRISQEITAVAQPIVDDGKRTIAMDAVDLAALGLDPASSSGSMPAARDSGQFPTVDDDSSGGGKKKKKKKR